MNFWGTISFVSLRDAVKEKFEKNHDKKWKLIGLLFVKDNDPIATKYLRPFFGYYNVRSGDITEFYWAGWHSVFDDTPGSNAPGSNIAFDDGYFDSIRKDVSKNTNWTYGGGSELILFKASIENGDVVFNLGAAMCIDLRSLLLSGLEIDIFFEQIFDFADKYEGNTPVVDLFFNDTKRKARNSIWNIIKSLLPKEIGHDLDRYKHTLVKDISHKYNSKTPEIGPKSYIKHYGPE